MIDKELLRSVIEDKLSQTDCFLVSLSVSSTNSIVVAISKFTCEGTYCLSFIAIYLFCYYIKKYYFCSVNFFDI